MTEPECKRVVELERGALATPVRGLGVGVTRPSLPYRLDFMENWDKDGQYSCTGLLWNCKKEVRLLALEAYSVRWLPLVEDSDWEDIKVTWF